MTFRLTDSTAEPPPWREWDREQIDEALADFDEAVAHRKPNAKPSAKGPDSYNWQAVIARVADPVRYQAATKAERK